MKKNDLLFYKDYLKDRNLESKKILVSKFYNSYLIGPKINKKFDANSFYHRILSNSIYSIKKYKKCNTKTIIKYINNCYDSLNDNEVIEINKFGHICKHIIISLPGVINEE